MVVLNTKLLIIYGFLVVLVSCAELPPVVPSNGGPETVINETSRTAKRGGGGKSKQNIQHVQVVLLPNSHQVHQPNIDGDPQAAGYVWVPYLSDGPPSSQPQLQFAPSIQQPSLLSRNPFLQGTVQAQAQPQPLPVQIHSNNPFLQGTVPVYQPQGTAQQQKPLNNQFLQGIVPVLQPQGTTQRPNLSNNPFLQGTVPVPQPQGTVQQQKPSDNQFLQGTVPVLQPQGTTQRPNLSNNPFLQETVPVPQPQGTAQQQKPSSNPFLQGTPLFQMSYFPGNIKGNRYGWGHAGNQQVYPEDKPQVVIPANPQQTIQPVLAESPQIQPSPPLNPHGMHSDWGHADASGPRQVPNVVPQPQVLREGGVLNSKCLTARGQFPSDACNAYINCWNGEAIEQTCPDGLVFSTKGYCDYPENVDCYGRRVPAGIPPTPGLSNNGNGATAIPNQQAPAAPAVTNPPILTHVPPVDAKLRQKCLKPRGQFPSDSCNRYVNCWDDVINEEQCPEGLLFSEKGYCDYPQRVNCQASTPSRSTSSASPTTSATHETLITKECPADYGTFRDKADCTSYFTCLSGKVVAKYKCPEGLSYSDNLGVCDYNERVDCSKPPLIFTAKSLFMSKIANSLPNNLESCKPGTILRLNPQCTSALLCRNGLSEVVQCPTGLAYDSKTDKCVLPNLAQC